MITLVNNSPKMCANETGYVSVRVSGGKLIDDPATTEIEGYTIELVELQTGITIKSATDILNNGYIQPSQDVLIEGVKPQVTYVVRAIDSKGCIGESGHITNKKEEKVENPNKGKWKCFEIGFTDCGRGKRKQ